MLSKVLLGMATLMTISSVSAVDMKYYTAEAGVEAGFKSYVENLYGQTEIPASTTGFTDLFTSDGVLIVRGNRATGADEILALKQALMPVAGNKQWDHFPNTTTVYSTTKTTKIYQVWGKIQSTYDGGNCSTAYYQTHFTVLLDKNGSPMVGNGSLSVYDDYVVAPSESPTTIECTN